MSSQSSSESARTEQVITQFQLKSLQAILSSRIPHLLVSSDLDPPSSSSTRTRKRDRWFNLSLPDLQIPLPAPTTDPLLVDVILSPDDVILERWSASCDGPHPSPSPSSGIYKKSIVLLRSLHSLLRLLPCFKIFKLLLSSPPSSSSSNSNSSKRRDLVYRISSFAPPFTREEEKLLDTYAFTPVETQVGCLSLSVTYRRDLSDFDFAVSSLMPPPTIIPDYVGSPAADPMRSFPHSWSPSLPPSSPIEVCRNRRIPIQKASSGSSPTPSPPSLLSRLRLESAPVSIPTMAGLSGKSNLYRTPNHSDPVRSLLPPPSPRRMEQESSPRRMEQESSSPSRSFRKSEGLKLADFYSNLHMYTAQKGLKDGRDDSGRFSGAFSSSGSPRFGISRSSSRRSIQDDLDDMDFSYPFAVDDVDTSDSHSRNLGGKDAPESSLSHNSSHKSQDAAVGALVHMLRTAPPLRQDQGYSSQSSHSEVYGEVGNSSFFVPRKTSDALEELRTYKEMREILLSQSRVRQSSVDFGGNSPKAN